MSNNNFLGKNNIPINLIYTKCDKINTSNIDKNIDNDFIVKTLLNKKH